MVEGLSQSQVAEAESAYASSESAHASSREALVALEIAQAESECEHDAALQALFQSDPRVRPLWSVRFISVGQEMRKACRAARARSPDGIRLAMSGPGVTPRPAALAWSVDRSLGDTVGNFGGRVGRGVAGVKEEALLSLARKVERDEAV